MLLLAAWKWTVLLKAMLDMAIDKWCEFVKFMLAESVYKGVLDNGNFREFLHGARGEFSTFKTGIPGGPDFRVAYCWNLTIFGHHIDFC